MVAQNSTVLSDTARQSRFAIPDSHSGGSVVFEFGTHTGRPGVTRITVPVKSTWTPSPHWHERYTEYLQVIRGRAVVVLDGQSRIVTAEDGPQVVQKYVVHEWYRADRHQTQQDEEELVVDEWTDPSDGIKQVFFRNLLGVITDRERYWRGWTAPQVLAISYAYDNFEPLVPGPKGLGFVVAHAVRIGVRVVMKVMGLRAWYERYVPEDLRQVAERGRYV